MADMRAADAELRAARAAFREAQRVKRLMGEKTRALETVREKHRHTMKVRIFFFCVCLSLCRAVSFTLLLRVDPGSYPCRACFAGMLCWVASAQRVPVVTTVIHPLSARLSTRLSTWAESHERPRGDRASS